MKDRDVLLVEKIAEAIEKLDEIDEMIKSQPTEIQTIDYELSDLYHLIENNELSDEASINVVNRIRELRRIRRCLNNEHEIETAYQTHKSKLAGNDTRKFLATEIHKTVNKLNNEYKNRVLTKEQIQELIEVKPLEKKKRGRPKKETIER